MFFKKTLENDAFNKIVIRAIGEGFRVSGRQPTESEFYSNINRFVKQENGKLSTEQENSVQLCAVHICHAGLGMELIPEYKDFFSEYPRDLTSYNKIFEILSRRALLRDNEALSAMFGPFADGDDILRKYGLK